MIQRLHRRWACAACAAFASVALAQPTIDGTAIPSDFSGATVVTQRFQTQFGDNAGDRFTSGSELDQMFVTNDGTYLYIGLTGNLENNGNAITVFLDVDGTASGASTVATRSTLGVPVPGLPRYLSGNPGPFADPGLDGLTFDAGFAPDYAMGWSGGSPRGSQTRTYYLVNWSTIAADANDPAITNVTAGMMTDGDPTASGPSGTLGSFLATGALGILGASDNSNGAGVDGGTAQVDDFNTPLPQPTTATTGFELAIPLSLLGVTTDDEVCLYAVVSGTTGWLSNQMLPPPATEASFSNPGFPPYDLGTATGNQYVCYTIVGPGCGIGCESPGGYNADIGPFGALDCHVNLTDLGDLLLDFGSPSSGTGAGDLDGNGNTDLTDLGELLLTFGASCP